jgi:hypothetical protein
MKVTKLIATAKLFLGPLVCVACGWLAFRWTAGLIAAAKLWPWLDCSWGGCSLPPPPQTYVIMAGVAIVGVCVYVMLGSLIYMGWRWFRSPEAYT